MIRERIDQEKALQEVVQAAEEAAAAVEEAGGDWRGAFLASWNGDADDAMERASRSSAPDRRGAADAGATAEKPDWDASTAAGDTHKSAATEGDRNTFGGSYVFRAPSLRPARVHAQLAP